MSIRTSYANAFETTLSAEMGATDLEAVVVSLAGAPDSPAYLVMEPDVPARREYILFDGTFSEETLRTTVIGNRYLSGSTSSENIIHPIGSVVRMSPLKQHFDDLHDRVETRLSSSSHTTSAHNSLGISHTSLTNRSESDSHSILAITNLQGELDLGKIEVLTEAQRDALSGAQLWVGRVIFNSDVGTHEGWDGAEWSVLGGDSFHIGEEPPVDDNVEMWYRTGTTGAVPPVLEGAKFQDAYAEREHDIGSVSGTINVNLATANFQTINPTGNVTLSFTNPPETDYARPLTLVVLNSTYTISWPAGTKFAGGEPPELDGETWLSVVARPDGSVTAGVAWSGVA